MNKQTEQGLGMSWKSYQVHQKMMMYLTLTDHLPPKHKLTP